MLRGGVSRIFVGDARVSKTKKRYLDDNYRGCVDVLDIQLFATLLTWIVNQGVYVLVRNVHGQVCSR